MRVRIPSPLRSYTSQQAVVQAEGESLDAVLRDLDRQFPGFRFRIVNEQDALRPHMVLFVNGTRTLSLAHALGPDDEVVLVQALSGG